MLNEAALLTARGNKKLIDNYALDEAVDRVVAGPQKKTRLMNEHEKKITAYHEGGHALVAAALPNSDPVRKITILPRGRALGYTMILPDDDKYSKTRNEMLDNLAYLMGGRAAEELVFHDPTTGAANDIEKATSLARSMVTQYGMTERLGTIKFGQEGGEVFLGRDMGHQRNYSEQVAAAVDEEVRSFIEDRARRSLRHPRGEPRHPGRPGPGATRARDAQPGGDRRVFSRLRKRPNRPAWTGSSDRRPGLPPVLTPAEEAILLRQQTGTG